LGLFGFHRLYLEDYDYFVIYMFTLSICGVGFFVDLFYLPTMIKRYNKKVKKQKDIISRTGTEGE
ncbi:hypothetical protein DICPUDRAFT_13540, partial [Dictyostelium purpureum]